MSRRRRTLVLLVDGIHLASGNTRHFLDLPPLDRRRFHGDVQQRRGPRGLAPHAPVQHLLLVLRLDGVLLAVPVSTFRLVEGDSPLQSHHAPLLAQEGVQQAQVGDAAAEAVVGDEDGLEAGKSGEGVPVQLQDAVVAEVQRPQLLHLGEHVLVAHLPQVVAPQVQLLQRGEERRQHPQVQRLQLKKIEPLRQIVKLSVFFKRANYVIICHNGSRRNVAPASCIFKTPLAKVARGFDTVHLARIFTACRLCALLKASDY